MLSLIRSLLCREWITMNVLEAVASAVSMGRLHLLLSPYVPYGGYVPFVRCNMGLNKRQGC
jgi:hypothetical protein